MKRIVGNILRSTEFRPLEMVYAHCDVPCGVYEPDSMTHAAQTVYMMTEKLLALEHPSGEKGHIDFVNTAARMVATKEEWAEKCKRELLILWTDYFKPEHFEKWPELTNKIHAATKRCSAVKREVNIEAAEKLKDMVAEIAEIFRESKK